MSTMRASRFLFPLASLLSAALAAPAQLPAAHLSWVFPPGAPTSSTLEITVAGSDLDEPADLVFSDPRITATPRTNGAPVFRVTIPSGVPAGLVDVRFAGRFGVSNPRGFQIGSEPEWISNPTNTTPLTAFEMDLDSVVNSRVQPANTYWFRFNGRKGQRLSAQVLARPLDSRLVPDLAILNSSLRELRIVRRNPILDFLVPDDGAYFLRLNDQTYRGGDDYVYRLTLSSRPRVEFAFPLALASGVTQRVTLFGWNLPGSRPSPLATADGQPLEQSEIDLFLPADPGPPAPLECLVLRKPAASVVARDLVAVSPTPGDWTHPPLPFARTPYPSTWSLSNGLSPVAPPCEFSGAFPRRGEVSGVVFDAKKDSVHWIEVFSERLGYNTDPHLVVQQLRKNDQGQEQPQDVLEIGDVDANLGGREFDTTSRDGVGRFLAPEDGTYRILVRDLYRGGDSSPRLPYRIQIRPETPDYRLAVFPQPPPRRDDTDRQIHLWTPVLRRGSTIPVRVLAFRRDGFDGGIEIRAMGLPPGVTASPARIAQGQAATTLLLTAAEDAPAGRGVVQVTGRSRIGDRDIDRTAIASSGRWHVPDWDQERGNPRFSESLLVAVVAVESAPVTLAPSETKPIEVVLKGKLQIPIGIVRQGEFTGPFKVKPFGHPALDKARESDVPEKATNAVVVIDLAEAQLPVGEHLVHLEATVAGRYSSTPEAAQAAAEKAKPRDVSVRVYSVPVCVRVTSPPTPAP